ncbi:MAG TPA: hypothetical protein VI485_27485 [Vicinamibacterales bacterium]|nr:hypothetical protein [Vicinamibacterales bacterium]
MENTVFRRCVESACMALAVGTLVGCGGDSVPTTPTSPSPSPEAFTVSVVPRTTPGNVLFFPMFGSLVGVPGVPTSMVIDVQRSPAGSLTGGWSSTPTSGVVGLSQGGLNALVTATGAGDATITFRDNQGPSASFVLRSAPRFDGDITITGNTNTASADCLDTTPPGTTSICTDNGDIGLGQRAYNFALTSTATGTPPVVSVSGSFSDGAFGLGGLFRISNAPTIDAGGNFAPSGQTSANYTRPGVFAPPRVSIPVTIREDWTITRQPGTALLER